MTYSRGDVGRGGRAGGNPDDFREMASELAGSRIGGKRGGSKARVGGNPASFLDMAEELFDARSNQGSGKTIQDRGSFSSAGNPKQFLDMASDLLNRR